jgi:UDP-N-acetylmuramoyl-L-alanyl-D-glutamate--2,6-diaminopimelate ligase
MSATGGAGLRLIELMDGGTTQLGRGPAPKDVEITGLTADSRQARPGYLFAALPGAKADGSTYISDALARGVAAVLVPSR